jgi:hypothetical protein
MLSPRLSLRLALDPAQVLRLQGLEPDPWQRDVLRSPAPYTLLCCSRQSGKSTTLAALALHTALVYPDALILLLSPSLRQSTELFRKVRSAWLALERPLPAESASQTRLELANGARIVSLPGREATLRSFSGPRLVIIDEAARVPDDLYRSVRPMLAVSRGRMVALSTPFGQRGFFWREWAHGGDVWKRVRVTWRECPRIDAAFIAQERQALGESWVRQEYVCSFEALEGLVFPDFAERCAVDVVPDAAGARRVGGIDFGYRNPFAALWGFVDRDDVLWIIGEVYGSEMPLHEHARQLPRGVTWFADPAGCQEIVSLRRAGFVVRKGINDIRAGIAAVQARLQTGRLRVLRGRVPHLLAEARLYRYPAHMVDGPNGETPVDAHNHALAALRYLISRLDGNFLARFRRQTVEPAWPGDVAMQHHDHPYRDH